jgi:hypothetical protein
MTLNIFAFGKDRFQAHTHTDNNHTFALLSN